MKTWRRWMCAAACCAVLLCSKSARAGFTAIKQNSVEPNQRAILDHLLGGHFAADGMGFSNGAIRCSRIDDDEDQNFAGKKFVAKAVARFSDYSQSFGCFDKGSFAKSFDVSGNHFDVSGQATIDMTHDSAFARFGDSGIDSSISADNSDGRDHLVTYKITGAGGAEKFLLFWEDLDRTTGLSSKRTTADFNDLVIELTAASATHAVPLPAAAWSGLGLSGAILFVATARRV
jgi:hypothetical protein